MTQPSQSGPKQKFVLHGQDPDTPARSKKLRATKAEFTFTGLNTHLLREPDTSFVESEHWAEDAWGCVVGLRRGRLKTFLQQRLRGTPSYCVPLSRCVGLFCCPVSKPVWTGIRNSQHVLAEDVSGAEVRMAKMQRERGYVVDWIRERERHEGSIVEQA